MTRIMTNKKMGTCNNPFKIHLKNLAFYVGAFMTLAMLQPQLAQAQSDDPLCALTLVKKVVGFGTDDGSDPTDWTLKAQSSAGSVTFTSGVAKTIPGSTTYTLSETAPAGVAASSYTASAWSCTQGTDPVTGLPKPLVAPNSLVGNQLTLGTTNTNIICEITNTRVPTCPSLTLRKIVINNDGGTATAANFTLTATGPNLFRISGTDGVTTTTTSDAIAQGTYTLSETDVAGYDQTDLECHYSDNTDIPVDLDTIVIDQNLAVTCTFTNDDFGAQVCVHKVITVPEATPLPTIPALTEFSFTVTTNNVTGPATPFSTDDDTGTVCVPVHANTAFSVREVPKALWTPSYSAGCDGTVPAGGTGDCTITNRPQGPSFNKIADAALVDAGNPIGYTIRIKNGFIAELGGFSGPDDTDPLTPPARTFWVHDLLPNLEPDGLVWFFDQAKNPGCIITPATIDLTLAGGLQQTLQCDGADADAVDDDTTCTLTKIENAQHLRCVFGNMGPTEVRSIHITSETVDEETCCAVDNEAFFFFADPGPFPTSATPDDTDASQIVVFCALSETCSITINRESSSDALDTQPSTFVLDTEPTAAGGETTFQLDDDPNSAAPEQFFAVVPPGDLRITETVEPAGTTSESVECHLQGQAAGSLLNEGSTTDDVADLILNPGDNAICTFTDNAGTGTATPAPTTTGTGGGGGGGGGSHSSSNDPADPGDLAPQGSDGPGLNQGAPADPVQALAEGGCSSMDPARGNVAILMLAIGFLMIALRVRSAVVVRRNRNRE